MSWYTDKSPQMEQVCVLIDALLSEDDYRTIVDELVNNPGIKAIGDFVPQKLNLTYDSSQTNLENILYTISVLGYRVSRSKRPGIKKNKG
ncbi:MAG: hypothetical protein MI748_20400 [Opitutales bacterium]|nr:hypothetical protein [Opitutales bacterium]